MVEDEKAVAKAHGMISEAQKFISQKNYEEAIRLLTEVVNEPFNYVSDENNEYLNFCDVVDYYIYLYDIKDTKRNLIRVRYPYWMAYGLLAYVYIAEKNYEEAERAIAMAKKWNPLDLYPYIQEIEIFKTKRDLEAMKDATYKIYTKIMADIDLSSFYSELGFYYIEVGMLDAAYALYSASRQIKDSQNAKNEQAFINKQLGRESYEMGADEAIKLLDSINVRFGISSEAFAKMCEVYNYYKRELYEKKIEHIFAKRVYMVSRDKNFTSCFITTNKQVGFSFLSPRWWYKIEDQTAKEFAGADNLYMYRTIDDCVVQIGTAGKAEPGAEKERCLAVLEEVKQRFSGRINVVKSGSLVWKIHNGSKEFYYSVFDLDVGDEKERFADYVTTINGNIICFSTTMSLKTDCSDETKFSKDPCIADFLWMFEGINEDKE